MAITQVEVASPAGLIQFNDTAMGGAAADGVKSSSAVVYSVFINNSANAAASYVKLFNLASGSVVIGTTSPDEIIFVPGLATITHYMFTSANPGKTFATALSACCVTTGGTGGTTSPGASVSVTINYV
jgi:hypothetical protein